MQIRIPTIEAQPNGRVFVTFGKEGLEFGHAADAETAADMSPLELRNLARRIAFLLATRRKSLRGKTLTIDFAAETNLVTVS